MLVFGADDEAFIRNVQTVFQLCREKNVTFIAKNMSLGLIQFPVTKLTEEIVVLPRLGQLL